MKKSTELKKHLRRGNVYRRNDLEKWSNSVDRHLTELVSEGTLQKLSQGLYYYPKETAFGIVPPDEKVLVRSFLKDSKFLLTSPNDYNRLGVGTTQLYNKRVVYNKKRHGELELGGRKFFFHIKPRFPKEVTQEFLLVDLVNNLDALAEDTNLVLSKVQSKVKTLDMEKLRQNVKAYGSVKAKKLFLPMLNTQHNQSYA
ncbi:DUF6088 family protein [Flavobacterium sp. NRK1]|uniref:DUF6088 family protein n=1 Tax=Flavobacterium sp. NRK1 TaxID=2954929 RepID=UPI002092C765|nr:DUF6088 family protein [Flavobacterium sp. NRK1]MCO6148944.1 DUF6088 family protein [Flavobacterium sp. NRK1]